MLLPVNAALQVFLRLEYVSDSVVAVIYTCPNLLIRINQSMLVVIVTAIPDVQAAHEGYLLVDDNHLLVMRP